MLKRDLDVSDFRTFRREFRAETVSEAIKLACAELKVAPEDLIYEVKDSGLLNILGFDSGLATIMVFQDAGDNSSSPDQASSGQDSDPLSVQHPVSHSEAFEVAARKYGLSYRDVVDGFADGAFKFTPDGQSLRLVQANQISAVTEKSVVRSTKSFDRVPAGYWAETDSLIQRFRGGEEKLLWEIVLRLDPIIAPTVDKVFEVLDSEVLDRDDLLQTARIEIIGLIGSYEPESETRIYVYLRHWLYYKIMRTVQNSSLVRVPINNPNPELKLRADHFTKPCSYTSLDSMPENFGLSDETGFSEMMSEDLYRRVMQRANLSERQWHVLSHRYGLDGTPEMTLKQLGAALCLTRERVRQIQKDAEKRIKYEFYLAFSKERRSRSIDRVPKSICLAIARGDFYLGDDLERETSISAAHEWPGVIYSYRRPAECAEG